MITKERAGALLLGGDIAESAEIGAYAMNLLSGEPAGPFPGDAVLTVAVGGAVIFAAARAIGAKTLVGAALAAVGVATLGGLVIAYQVKKQGGDAINAYGERLGAALGKALPVAPDAQAGNGRAGADPAEADAQGAQPA